MTATVTDLMGVEYNVNIDPAQTLSVVVATIADATGLGVGNFIILREGEELSEGDHVMPGDRLELDISPKIRAVRELQKTETPITENELNQAIVDNDYSKMKLLLEAGVEATRPAVVNAVHSGPSTLKILNEYGMLSNWEEMFKHDLLLLTVENDDVDAFKLLLTLDSSWVDEDGIHQVLKSVIEDNKPAYIDILMNSGLLRCDTSTDSSNPLIEASKRSGVKMVKRLLRFGFDPNFATLQSSKTPFLAAAGNPSSSLRVMKLLVQNGADPKAKNDAGETALHVAARKGTIKKCFRYLTEDIGLSFTEEDFNGFTPKMLVKGPIESLICSDPDPESESESESESEHEDEAVESVGDGDQPEFPDFPDEPAVEEEVEEREPFREPEPEPEPAAQPERPQPEDAPDGDDELYQEAVAHHVENKEDNDNGNCSVM